MTYEQTAAYKQAVNEVRRYFMGIDGGRAFQAEENVKALVI